MNAEKEIWKKIDWIENLPPIYEVSTQGHVRKISSGYVLSSYQKDSTKVVVDMQYSGNKKKQTTRSVGNLVATAFLPNPYNSKHIEYIDGDFTNNCVDNLKWKDSSKRSRLHYRRPYLSNQEFSTVVDYSEEWRPLYGYEGLYEISNIGRIRRLAKTIILSNGNTKSYPEKYVSPITRQQVNLIYCVRLTKKKSSTTLRLHKLVAQTFVPNPNEFKEVLPIDGDFTNCCADNLRWVSDVEYALYQDQQRLYTNLLPGFIWSRNPVEVEELKLQFNSISDAMKYFNSSRYKILRAIERHTEIEGVHLRFTHPTDVVKVSQARLVMKCLETGEMVSSMAELARKFSVNYSSVAWNVKHKGKYIDSSDHTWVRMKEEDPLENKTSIPT